MKGMGRHVCPNLDQNFTYFEDGSVGDICRVGGGGGGGGWYEEVRIEEERGRRPSSGGVFVFI